jgi:hypothetical protein
VKSVYRTRLATLTALVLGTSNIRTRPTPFFAIHIPGVEETLPDQIEQARFEHRPIFHVHFGRPDGEPCLKMQQEEPDYVTWSHPEDAPMTTETTIKLDGSKTHTQVPARFGAGCRVPNENDHEDIQWTAGSFEPPFTRSKQ